MAATFSPKSIVLPLFGTGNGGESAEVVGPIVIPAVTSFLRSHLFEPDLFPFSDIHVSCFSVADVAALAAELAKLKTV